MQNFTMQYREFVLDDQTGSQGYLTKTYSDIIPRNLERHGKRIQVKDNVLTIKVVHCHTAKVQTPVKSKSVDIELNIDKNETNSSIYKCVYCDHSTGNLENIVEHCSFAHCDLVLKYHRFDVEKNGYISLLHEGIIPSSIKSLRKNIIVKENMVLMSAKKSNDQSVNTPVKLNEYRYSTDVDCEIIESNDDVADVRQCLNEMEGMLPIVQNKLLENGELDSYMKFNKIIFEGKLPKNNICHLLFNDIVQWFSASNTSQMRYQRETIQFWKLGYRLFHGKFIRFMSGLRNIGHVLNETAEQGYMDPENSKLNFAVPAVNTCNLYRSVEQTKPIYPGLCNEHLDALSNALLGKPLKLCVDGKKICRGKGKLMGDIDCWGYESHPTLQERKDENKKRIEDAKNVQMKLDHHIESEIESIEELSVPDKTSIAQDLVHQMSVLALYNKLLREKASSLERLETKYTIDMSTRLHISNIFKSKGHLTYVTIFEHLGLFGGFRRIQSYFSHATAVSQFRCLKLR